MSFDKKSSRYQNVLLADATTAEIEYNVSSKSNVNNPNSFFCCGLASPNAAGLGAADDASSCATRAPGTRLCIDTKASTDPCCNSSSGKAMAGKITLNIIAAGRD